MTIRAHGWIPSWNLSKIPPAPASHGKFLESLTRIIFLRPSASLHTDPALVRTQWSQLLFPDAALNSHHLSENKNHDTQGSVAPLVPCVRTAVLDVNHTSSTRSPRSPPGGTLSHREIVRNHHKERSTLLRKTHDVCVT